ncbi:hypothetical protein FE697_004360 [Mumia zhuanghuii]|uniref:Lipoprotein n=2 Tax=Mumia TaxID=1546255 RepID=A0ABW1QLV1_9ACTN|nr:MULTISPECIES: hypothetical protein [Mumia]KAA1425116.1 hypothetical protein FE697_004360 [Mumia zhuanghuii]
MKPRLLAAAVLLMLSVSACGGENTDGDAPDESSQSTQSTKVGSLGSKEADKIATESASRIVVLWARPDVKIEDWAAELRPAMSTVGVSTLSFMDPSILEPAKPEGDARVLSGSDAHARVAVPTTAGEYLVTMSRDASGTAWLVDRVVSP